MPRELQAYIEEVLTSIGEIVLFLDGMNEEGYCKDAKTKAAVERKLLNIGEGLNQMLKVESLIESQITDCRKIIAFRNVLVHGYFGVDDALVWDVISSKLPLLKHEVEVLLSSL